MIGGHPLPDWVTVVADEGLTVRILGRPPLPSGLIVEPYDLTLRQAESGVIVGETVPGTRLPPRCPELHIQAEGAFCLGREANRLDTQLNAALFWRRLGDYLVHQHHAARRRRWPAGRWLSHGHDAADAQLAAEDVARKSGWVDDYADALENDRGWIADAVKSGVGPPGVSACRCEAKAGPGRRGRRRCPHRRFAERIVKAEHQRRVAEQAYFDLLHECGVRCCGRVDGCGLEGR